MNSLICASDGAAPSNLTLWGRFCNFDNLLLPITPSIAAEVESSPRLE
ncbi:hypothetical protein BKA23_0098 [Rudaeicoccus suwonensis]|uniref:Uncharacterized protein n=1 Tax=Rudaeicoccus suwonensis TaxID=657409 RepID=A0A561E6T4_9MICO|nr:hypothetical protein BKA23_0098 [Rudaeicoccus suwonensis]